MAGQYRVDDLVYDGQIYDAVNPSRDDLPFYLERCREAGGPVLELACGTGRLTLPLARAGVDIVGVDRSGSMLARARAKARRARVRLPLLRADILDLDLDRRFALVMLPFNALQEFYRHREVAGVLATARRHLAPGGRFVFDVFNPDVRLLVGTREMEPRYRGMTEDGRDVAISEGRRYDAAAQVVRSLWHISIDGGPAWPTRVDMRCFWPLELEALLAYHGWQLERRLGDFNGNPFVSASPKQVCVCRPGLEEDPG